MGLRSWLTHVEDVTEYVALKAQIRHNPPAYGSNYVIDITEDSPLKKGVWVSWSGDTRSSLEEFMSPHFCESTRLLDNLVDECPDYIDDPNKYGKLFTEEAEVLSTFTEQEAIGDGEILFKLVEEGHFARKWSAGLRKHDQPQIMGLGLPLRFGQRPEVGLPCVVLLRQLLEASFDEGRTLPQLEIGLVFRHVLLTSTSCRASSRRLASPRTLSRRLRGSRSSRAVRHL